MGWSSSKLSALLEKVIDNRGKTPPLVDDGIELIETTSLTGGGKFPDYSLVRKYVSQQTFDTWFRAGHPRKGDILVATVGANIGSAAMMREARGCVAQNLVGLRANAEKADPDFLYYYLTWNRSREELTRLDIGAAQPSLKVPHLLNVEILLPPLSVQRRIAGVLSAYDDLIENNQRRIKILEEMARSLYREWFVNLRFPGHEKLPLVDSPLGDIPQGWEVKHLQDVANVTYGFPFQSKKFNTTGVGTPVIRIRDILDASTDTFTDEDAEPKYHVKNGDILVGMDGDFHMCIWSSGHAFQNQRVAKFESRGEIGNFHLFLALELPIQTWNKSIVGTTVAHLGDMHIKTIRLAWPPGNFLAKVQEILEPMSEQIIALKRQIQNLRRTRDLLLLRLVSGRLPLKNSDG